MVTRRTRRRSTRWWSWSWCVVSSYTYCLWIGLRWLVCIKFQRSDWAWLTDWRTGQNEQAKRDRERCVGIPYNTQRAFLLRQAVLMWLNLCACSMTSGVCRRGGDGEMRERGKEKNKENGTLRLGTTYLPRLLLVGLFRMGRDDATRTSVLCGG